MSGKLGMKLVILINKLKSDLEGSRSNPMSHPTVRWYNVREHAHSERVMGSSPGQVMGVRGINDTRAEKAHDHLAIRPHGKPANSTTYTAG